MKPREFESKIKSHPRPMVVDLWAPWCAPCRAMEPAFKQVGQKYVGQVDVLKINADDSPDVLKALKVMSIPTVIGFAGGKEIMRRTGRQSPQALEIIFDAALHQRKPAVVPPTPMGRIVRSALGLILLAFAVSQFVSGGSTLLAWILTAGGGAVLFSAFYDRCPIYRAIAPRVAELFQRK